MDLICFSHIRWNFVYQRPQHLLNRFAIYNRVFVIEEPEYDQNENTFEIRKDSENHNLWIVNLKVSKNVSFEKRNDRLKLLLNSLIFGREIKNYILWYYSPMALKYSDHLQSALTIYDCMDELSAFKFAPPELKKMEVALMSRTDLIFTGGYSLYEAKKHLHHNIHPFPSSIDRSHFQLARTNKKDPEDQAFIPHPRFGFYGVIDERFDIPLIDELSTLRPDWHFVLVGPIIKIDPATLPRRENIHYLGGKNYKELPLYLSGWDVAILPFALNESTKYISPTKTPEYLAGGKPVISTSITDVVSPYGTQKLVHIADTAQEFILEAEKIFTGKNMETWKAKVDAFLATNSWNETWHKMSELIDVALENKFIMNTKKEKIYV